MKRYLSTIIKRARKERNLSQKRLIEEIGEYKISLRTLRRIEHGYQNASYSLVQELLDYLGIELKYSIRDEYEDNLVRKMLLNVGEYSNINECLNEIDYNIEVHRLLFNKGEHRYRNYHIKTLTDFLLYYPLFDMDALNEALYRIGGGCHEAYYVYILEQMERLYESIPSEYEELKQIAGILSQRTIDGEVLIDSSDLQKYRIHLEKRSKKYGNRDM